MHTGTKVKKIREIRGLKQEALASKLGISHQAVSKIEQSEEIDDEKLTTIAEALGVTVDTIKNFDENAAFQNVQYNQDSATGSQITYQFNPVDKIVELYERMLETERSKVKMLEELLKEKTR